MDGMITDSVDLTYTKTGLGGTGRAGKGAVLSVPSFKAKDLAGDLNVDGYSLKNAVLVNAKLTDSSITGLNITAKSITLQNMISVSLLGMYIHVYKYVYLYIYTNVCIYVYICMHVYIHIYIYTYLYE
jgi:hypothetical protein